MTTQHLIPRDKISGYVDRILVIENKAFDKPFVLPLYANGVPTLLYTSVMGKVGTNSANHLTLFGQTVWPDHLTLTEDFCLIAYFFKPYCLLPLFGIEGYELTDKPVDLQLAANQNYYFTLKEKLLNAGSAGESIEILDDYVVHLINQSKSVSSSLKRATTFIYKHYSKESLTSIRDELNITERSFQRLFHKGMGINPNTYRRICQFNAAFFELNLGNYKSLSDVAFNHGYADQSHYIRAFREFTSITPLDYLNFGR